MGEPPEEVESKASPGPAGLLRRHPVLTGVFLAAALVGAALGFALLGDDWSALRRIAAGAVAGAGSALLITATKMFG